SSAMGDYLTVKMAEVAVSRQIRRKSVKSQAPTVLFLLSGLGSRNEPTSNIRSRRLACRNARHRPTRRMARQHRRTVSRVSAGKSGHSAERGGRGVCRLLHAQS